MFKPDISQLASRRNANSTRSFERLEPRYVLDSTVVFSELMYNPGDDQELEWIELHNLMAVDMDVSRWTIDGIDYTFPEGTIIPARQQTIVAKSPAQLQELSGIDAAWGPYAGQLSNSGERLRLLNNSDRVMDELRYRDEEPWPVAPDGSGASLAKRVPEGGTDSSENWTTSLQIGGTPNGPNFPPGPDDDFPSSLRFNELTAGGSPSFWVELIYQGDQPLDLAGTMVVSRDRPADAYTFSSGTIQPGAYVRIDSVQLGFTPAIGDRLFLFGPGRGAVLDGVVVDEFARARSAAHEDRWLRPSELTPSAENRIEIEQDIVINEIMYHAPGTPATPDTPATFDTTPLVALDEQTIWRYRDSNVGLASDWFTFGHAVGVDGWKSGAAPIGFDRDRLPVPFRTTLTNPATIFPPVKTYYFECEFDYTSDMADPSVQLLLNQFIDDGAVFYLNGIEVHRYNMADGIVDADTLASAAVNNAARGETVVVPSGSLRQGSNRLSVEVHQDSVASADVVFGVELSVGRQVTPFVPGKPFRPSEEEWIELYNQSRTRTIDLGGWKLADAIAFTFPAGQSIGPGQYVVIARHPESLAAHGIPPDRLLGPYNGNLSNGHEIIRLLDHQGNPADEVHYFDGGRWPQFADGGGSSLELRDPRSDNTSPEAWAGSQLVETPAWRMVTYRGVVERDGFTNGVTSRYQEFILGLLDAGELLIDDVSVVESPGVTAVQRIQNGSFEQDAVGQPPSKWRISGNHHGQVIADPWNAGNHVLHLRATGALEDRLNHAETTFGDSAKIREGVEYEISFRALWLAGSNQLTSRLYFNRLARTTLLDRPTRMGTPGQQNLRAVPNAGPTYDHLKHEPAVPAADQPVTVSIDIADPDGIAEATLWYSVHDGPSERLPMATSGKGAYTVTIPGQGASRIVQFYVQGTDAGGATSFFPAQGANSRTLYKVQDGRASQGLLHNFRIVMTPADTRFLHTPIHQMSNERLGATVIYNESQVFYNVGVRLKGSNAGRSDAAYLGFNVEFDPMRLFRGVHDSVAIDRSGRSGSTPLTQDEILIKHIANSAGDIPFMYDDLIHVLAPNQAHNRTALLVMAGYGDEFLDSQFENGSDGTVFRLDIAYVPNGTMGRQPENPKIPFPYSHPQPTKDLQNLGDDKELYRTHLQIRNNREADDFRRIIALSKAWSLDGQALLATANDLIDVDQWARMFALQSLTGAADVYTRGGLHHNINFYVRPSDQRVIALPWDWDVAFTASVNQPLIGTDSNTGKLLNLPTVRRLVHGHLLDILTTTFHNGYLDRWIDHYGQVARQNLRPIKNYVTQRRDFVLRRLPASIPFEITTNSGDDLTVGERVLSLEGTGWINVREIRRAGTDRQLPVTWLDDGRWRAPVSLQAGANVIALEAIDHQGQVVGADQLVVTLIDPVVGDFDQNGSVDIADVDVLCAAIRTGDEQFDLDADDAVTASDLTFLLERLLRTGPGDVNLDGVFSSADLVLLFQIGEYEDPFAGNSAWSEGDWNCDGDFTTADLVLAWQFGRYVS